MQNVSDTFKNVEIIFRGCFYPQNDLFLHEKARKYVTPDADLPARWLLPNHFRWMIEVKHEKILATD